MDVNSGSVHVVDEIVYDMIPLVEPLVNEGIKDAATIKTAVLNLVDIPYPQEQIEEAVDEVLALEKAGQLFAPDIYENYIFDFKNRQTVVKALCLQKKKCVEKLNVTKVRGMMLQIAFKLHWWKCL